MKNEDERNNNREKYGLTWEAIFLNSKRSLKSQAMRLTNGESFEAEDLVQDTFLRIFYYSPDPNRIKNPEGYLKRTLKNLWNDKLREFLEMKMQSIDEENNEALLNQLPSVQPEVIKLLENEVFLERLRIAQIGLKPLEKNIFKLFLKGYKCDEIAVRVKENKYKVKFVLNAVRAKIRYRIKNQ